MKTKNIFAYAIFSLLILQLSACESPLQDIVGEYSFKVSGQVTKDATQQMALTDEMGAMEIIHLSDSTFLLTFNTLNGSAYTTQAVLSNNQLDLIPFARTVIITYKTQNSNLLGGLIELTETEYYNTEVYGYGTIYDNTIKFTLQYSGKELSGNKKIKGNNIIMLAKKH